MIFNSYRNWNDERLYSIRRNGNQIKSKFTLTLESLLAESPKNQRHRRREQKKEGNYKNVFHLHIINIVYIRNVENGILA